MKKALEVLSSISSIPMEIEGRLPDRLVVLAAHDEPLIGVIERTLYPLSHMIVERSDGMVSIVLLEGPDDADPGQPQLDQPTSGQAISDEAQLLASDDGDSMDSLEAAELEVLKGASWTAEANAGELYPPEDGQIAVTYEAFQAEILMVSQMHRHTMNPWFQTKSMASRCSRWATSLARAGRIIRSPRCMMNWFRPMTSPPRS